MVPEMAYEIIHDELMLDGNARLNLATFVTTWLELLAEKLMAECADKNNACLFISNRRFPPKSGTYRRVSINENIPLADQAVTRATISPLSEVARVDRDLKRTAAVTSYEPN
jgi:hypothetical protein